MSDLAVPESRGLRELRLALVCYGGVSLAIYMHGITKEIQRLVVASAAFERSRDENPFPEGRSEREYWELLRELDARGPTARRGVRTRVVVDIISGTSAGGINGICLAKALATNRSQDALKPVWFERGDITTLLHGPKQLHPIVRFPVVAVMSLLWRRPPSFLRGEAMSGWLLDAMNAMDASAPALPDRDSLVPADDPSLQLFVPITDFHGYTRTIAMDDPKVLHDITHRHLLRFDYARLGRAGFTGKANHALAFAARATSSFPGAFAAVSVDDYARSVPDGEQLREVLGPLFEDYRAMRRDPEASWFVDGGVLDNLPFESTIRAIGDRPASTEVDRRLLFIDPNPPATATPEEEENAPAARGIGQAPSWLSAALHSIATIPRAEPVIDELRQLAARNDTVMRIREIIETAFPTVTTSVLRQAADVLGWQDADAWPDRPTLSDIRTWRAVLEDAAADEAGLTFNTYLRLRISQVLDSYARQLADILDLAESSDETAFVRTALRRRAADIGLLSTTQDVRERQQDFLRAFDLAYHERSMRFLVAGFSWWYRDQDDAEVPPRADLDHLKRGVYRQIVELRRIGARLATDDDLTGALRQVFDQAAIERLLGSRDERQIAGFVADRAALLDRSQDRVRDHIADAIAVMEERLYEELATRSSGWSAAARRALLVRYIGFPFWDVLIFPVQTLSDVGERDHVEVSRISPLDATLLSHGQPSRAPLSGASLHHFGAFFDGTGREHDYLWGRLDAAERLVTLLFDDPYRPGLQPPDPEHCARVFRAIVDEERSDGLRNTTALDDVHQRIGRMPRGPVVPSGPLVSSE